MSEPRSKSTNTVSCMLCGLGATSPNPIVGEKAPKLFKDMAHLPWKKYNKDGEPVGRLCRFCPAALQLAGFPHKDAYAFHADVQKDIGLRNALAACVERYIMFINEGAVRFAPKGPHSLTLSEVRITTVEAFKTRQKRIKGPKVELITVDAWVKEKGYHPSKDGLRIMYEEVEGKVQPCVGRLLGKLGHYTMVTEDIVGAKQTEMLDDGSAQLMSGQADNRFEMAATAIGIEEADLSFLDDLLNGNGDPTKATGDDGENASDGENGDSDDEEEPQSSIIGGLLKTSQTEKNDSSVKAKPKVKAKAATTNVSRTGPKRSAPPLRPSGSCSTQPPPTPGPQGHGSDNPADEDIRKQALQSIAFANLEGMLSTQKTELIAAMNKESVVRVSKGLDNLMTEMNKGLHSLRRRKVPCPAAVDDMLQLKKHTNSCIQMASTLSSATGASTSWEALEPIQSAFLEVPGTQDVPLKFKLFVAHARANDSLGFSKFDEVVTQLDEIAQLSHVMAWPEILQHRGMIVEGLLGRILQSTRRKGTFDHVTCIIHLLSRLITKSGFFEDKLEQDLKVLHQGLQNPSDQEPEKSLKDVEALQACLASKSTSLKSIGHLPLFKQVLAERLSTIQKLVDQSKNAGSLKAAVDHFDNVLCNLGSMAALSTAPSTDTTAKMARLLCKVSAYIATSPDNLDHKRGLEQLHKHVFDWAQQRLQNDVNAEAEAFMDAALDETRAQRLWSAFHCRCASPDMRDVFAFSMRRCVLDMFSMRGLGRLCDQSLDASSSCPGRESRRRLLDACADFEPRHKLSRSSDVDTFALLRKRAKELTGEVWEKRLKMIQDGVATVELTIPGKSPLENQFGYLVSFAKASLGILQTCIQIFQMAAKRDLNEQSLGDVANLHREVSKAFDKYGKDFSDKFKESYRRWQLLSPIRQPAYELYKIRFAAVAAPTQEDIMNFTMDGDSFSWAEGAQPKGEKISNEDKLKLMRLAEYGAPNPSTEMDKVKFVHFISHVLCFAKHPKNLETGDD